MFKHDTYCRVIVAVCCGALCAYVRVVVVGRDGHLGLLLGRSLVGTHGRVSVFFASTVDLIVQTGDFAAEGLCLGIKRGPSSRAAESLFIDDQQRQFHASD